MLKFLKHIIKKDTIELDVNEYNRLKNMEKSIIIEKLKNKAIFKTNLICSYYGEACKDILIKRQQEELFFKFGRTICNSKIIKYLCIITANEKLNGKTTYIVTDTFAIEELKKIANECNVLLEYIDDKLKVYTILSSPYIGIREPISNRILKTFRKIRSLDY